MREWSYVKLGEIVSYCSGGSFPEKYQGRKNEEYDFYKVSDMNSDENKLYMTKAKNTVNISDIKGLKAKIHTEGTVIFPKVGAALLTNKRRLLSKPSLFDNNIMGIIGNECVNSKYLYYFMNTVDFKKTVQSGAVPSINKKIVDNIMVLLPNIDEQQKIAEILSSVDEVIEKTEAIIKQTEAVKKGLMQQLLTKGIGHTEFKQTEIGEVPVEWNFKKLGDVLNFIGSGSTPKGGRSAYPASGITFIRSQNVYPDGLRLEEVVFIKEETHETMKRSKVKEKDVLLNITGASIGRCTFVPIGFSEANVNQHVCILRSIPALNYKYLSYFMNSVLGQKQIFSEQNGQTREGLNYQQIKKFDIPLPPIEEQEKIVKVIEGVNEKYKAEIKRKQLLQLLKTSLMQSLLTGKVRVNVDQPEVLV